MPSSASSGDSVIAQMPCRVSRDVVNRPQPAVEQALAAVVAQADQLVAGLRIGAVEALQLAEAVVVAPARAVAADQHLVGGQDLLASISSRPMTRLSP